MPVRPDTYQVCITILLEKLQNFLSNFIFFSSIVSVMWTLDADANVVDTWFGRTVIRSACEMEYEQAQGLLDGKDVVPGLDAKVCKQLKPAVVLLAKTMRKVRVSVLSNVLMCWQPFITWIRSHANDFCTFRHVAWPKVDLS